MKDSMAGAPKSIISFKFHNAVVKFSKDICKLIRKDTGVNEVALSGGVFRNSYLLRSLTKELKNEEFVVYTNKLIATNDGGVALGQIVIANEILNNK
nr:hypothetical protein [Clostridium sp. DJ247]